MHAITITVPITSAWFDTGFDVVAGQRLQITAVGMVHWATGSPGISSDGIGDGWDGTQKTSGTVLPDAIWLSLIGKVGGTVDLATGTPVPEGATGAGLGFVGSSYDEMMVSGGRLYLGFNDTVPNFGDNSGAFLVTIESVPESGSVLVLLEASLFILLCGSARKRMNMRCTNS